MNSEVNLSNTDKNKQAQGKKLNPIVKYKYIIILLVMLLCFLPKVYSSESEVGMRAVVTSIGIDKTDNGYEVTAQAFIPTLEDSKSEGKTTVSAAAPSVALATSKFTVKLGRVTTLAHCKLIVLGESLCEEGVLPALDFIIRNGKVSWNAIVMATEGSSKDTINKINDLEKSSNFSWKNFFVNSRKNTNMPLCDLKTFMNNSYSTAKSSHMSIINIEEEISGEENDQENAASITVAASEDESPSSTINEKIKVMLFKEGKKSGILKEEEILGFTWLDKDAECVTLSIKNVGNKMYGDAIVSVRMSEKRVKTKYTFKDGSPVLSVKINALFEEVEIMRDYNITGISDKERNSYRKELEKKLNEELENNLKLTIEKCIEYQTDALNLNEFFYKFANKQYKKSYKQKSPIALLNDLKLETKLNSQIS